MKLLNSYSIIDTEGHELPSVEIVKVDGVCFIDNMDMCTEIMVQDLATAKDIAQAMRNRNQRNYNKKNGIRK